MANLSNLGNGCRVGFQVALFRRPATVIITVRPRKIALAAAGDGLSTQERDGW
jgi:hypothetical protein